jgi:WD40 repeat protein
MLLAIKSDKLVQVWDCKDIMEKQASYTHSDVDKCKQDFITLTSPLKEYMFEEGGAPMCCSWLPTDNSIFLVGYSKGQLCFFDKDTGKVRNSVSLGGEVLAVASHQLQSVIAAADSVGNV